MGKRKKNYPPEVVAAFVAALERIQEVTGTRTQVQLAEALKVRQSSISDAKRRHSIPDGWLVKLLRSHQAMPDWILTGTGPKHLFEAVPAVVVCIENKLDALDRALQHRTNEIQVALDMADITVAEFNASSFTM